MANPTSDTAISRPDLGVLVNEYIESQQAMMGFIGLQVMPLMPVARATGEYPVIPKEVMLSIQDTKRAMRGIYPSSDWEFENGFYTTSDNGWVERIDDTERSLYSTYFDSDALATRRAVNIVLRGQEKRIADAVFNAVNFTNHDVTNEWDDTVNATPIEDINDAKISVRNACGMLPNTLIISYSTYMNLKENSKIKTQLQYTFPGLDMNRLSAQQLAYIFDVPQVLIGGAIYNSAKKGQSASVASVWNSEYAMLTVCSSANDMTEPCIGRTMLWTGDSGSNTVVESYRDEERRCDAIRVRHYTGENLIASRDSSLAIKSNISAACSYLFSNITT